MRVCLALCAVLCLAAISNGDVVYTGTEGVGAFTLQYLSPADLGGPLDIDPIGVLADVAAEYGLTKADFRLLNPQVVGFNTATGSAVGTPQYLTVNYGTGTLTFSFAAKYNWGGMTTGGRNATSGTAGYNDISGVETQPGNSWFSTTISNSNPAEGLAAWGMCVTPRNDNGAGPGQAIFTLSDDTTATIDYPVIGGGGTNPATVWIGYQAPAGTSIMGIRCTRPGGGNSYVAMDDFSFTIGVPEPATMGLLLVGGLMALIRRRRA